MNEYNERWTRDKFIEYRKLKRDGYSHKMLIKHFGDGIYYSGIYKINLYGNIIKNSFSNVYEIGESVDVLGNKYYLYKLK